MSRTQYKKIPQQERYLGQRLHTLYPGRLMSPEYDYRRDNIPYLGDQDYNEGWGQSKIRPTEIQSLIPNKDVSLDLGAPNRPDHWNYRALHKDIVKFTPEYKEPIEYDVNPYTGVIERGLFTAQPRDSQDFLSRKNMPYASRAEMAGETRKNRNDSNKETRSVSREGFQYNETQTQNFDKPNQPYYNIPSGRAYNSLGAEYNIERPVMNPGDPRSCNYGVFSAGSIPFNNVHITAPAQQAVFGAPSSRERDGKGYSCCMDKRKYIPHAVGGADPGRNSFCCNRQKSDPEKNSCAVYGAANQWCCSHYLTI